VLRVSRGDTKEFEPLPMVLVIAAAAFGGARSLSSVPAIS
jgi:hypothetical protein